MAQVFEFPFVDLTPSHQEVHAEMLEAYNRVLASGWFICGPEVEAFESEFATYCGSKHCVGVSNGLDALVMILRSLEIGPGDEVIVPANSFIATALAVSEVGAKPIFADVVPSTFNIDPLECQRLLSRRTRAVIAVHLYGQLAEMAQLTRFCASNGLLLIEDAAQAHGASSGGRRAGNFGVAAAFSFYPGKNLGALGDGGAVTTNDSELAEKIRLQRGYGSIKKYVHEIKGRNARLDELQAAFLRCKLRHLPEWTEQRRQIASLYDRVLGDSDIKLPPHPAERSAHVWHLYVIRHSLRDAIQEALLKAGVQTLIHYPIPIHKQRAYADDDQSKVTVPVTESMAKELLSLPLWAGLDADRCAARIGAVCKKLAL